MFNNHHCPPSIVIVDCGHDGGTINAVTKEEFNNAMTILGDKLAALKEDVAGVKSDIATLATSEAGEDANAVAAQARIVELEAQIADLESRAVTQADLDAVDGLKTDLADAKAALAAAGFGTPTAPAPPAEPV